MDVKLINPFVEAVDGVFSTMLGLKATRNPIKITNGGGHGHGQSLTSLIGISGQASGVVVLRFPPQTALQVAGRLLGGPEKEINEVVVDAISEVVNMVAGSAKAKLDHDPPLQLGLPTVVQGSEYKVKYPSKSVWLEVPFHTEAGDFSLEVTFSAA